MTKRNYAKIGGTIRGDNNDAKIGLLGGASVMQKKRTHAKMGRKCKYDCKTGQRTIRQ